MAMHLPVNHPLRPLYRSLALFSGLFLLVFGLLGYLATQGDPLFDQGGGRALGLRTNPAFAYASLAAGVLVLLAILVGRNFDRFVTLWTGLGFMIAGTAMLVLLGTTSNFLNFTAITCMVSYVIGSVLFTAGLYTKTGPAAQAAAADLVRHGGH